MDPKVFEAEWFTLAKEICDRIYGDPEVQRMREDFDAHKRLTMEQRGTFIAIANRVKAEVIKENHGEEGSTDFETFRERWRNWFNHKGPAAATTENRRLTNEEHIVFSSTPDAEEFLANYAAKQRTS